VRESTSIIAAVILRNVALSLFLTKLFTQPLVGKFEPDEPDSIDNLIGRECVITTSEADNASGQASVRGVAAPHLLPVRVPGGRLVKGDRAEIVGYDEGRKVYLVSLLEQEPGPESATADKGN
jgi:hypothetical protein